MAMSTMASYVSRRILSSSLVERNAAKHILIKKNELGKLQGFSSKAEASREELNFNNMPSSAVEGGIRAGRHDEHYSLLNLIVSGVLVAASYHCYRIWK